MRITLFLAALLLSSVTIAAPVKQSATPQQANVEYRLSGKYLKDITKITREAERYLVNQVRANLADDETKSLAIVLDVEETALSNYSSIYKIEDKRQYHAAHFKRAIAPVRDLYRVAVQHNVRVFFISSAKEKQRDLVNANLKHAGYYFWTDLYLEPNDYDKKSTIPYKIAARKQIKKAGYDILFTMGDQYSDIAGPNTGRKYRLPNPFYKID